MTSPQQHTLEVITELVECDLGSVEVLAPNDRNELLVSVSSTSSRWNNDEGEFFLVVAPNGSVRRMG